MYRNPGYSEYQHWENMNRSQQGNRRGQQNEPYGYQNEYQRYASYQRYNERPDQGRNYNQSRMEVYHTDYDERRDDRYRNNEFRGSYRFDNDRNYSGYQQLNERNFGPDYGYGHAGSSRSGGDYGRHQSDYGSAGTYGASRNAGSMGSYGGAQGYGSSRNGYNSEKWGSGHHGVPKQVHHTVYGAYRDKNSFAPGERESYDGSQRSGSQGADSTRGWTTPGRSGRSGSYRHYTPDDDSRYEIYDTSESQYNRGEYNNDSRNSISDDLNLRSHQNYSPNEVYGSRNRALNRQGSGSDQDRYLGYDLDYQNTAGSLSVGYDGYRSRPITQNRYYDPLSGDVRNPGSERYR